MPPFLLFTKKISDTNYPLQILKSHCNNLTFYLSYFCTTDSLVSNNILKKFENSNYTIIISNNTIM